MKFIDEYHKKFYNEKLQMSEIKDNYTKSLIYLLALNSDTRSHFNEIFDIEEREVNRDVINRAWQTSGSEKVTRLALNLWNGTINDDENEKNISGDYSVTNLFCCSYASYFFEAIKLKYPEYTMENLIEQEEDMEY